MRKGFIRLSWTASSDSGATYNVYRGSASGGVKGQIAPGLSANRFDDDDRDLVLGTTYFYQVSAVNAVGESVLSDEVSAMAE